MSALLKLEYHDIFQESREMDPNIQILKSLAGDFRGCFKNSSNYPLTDKDCGE
jgi:hypothetical protein